MISIIIPTLNEEEGIRETIETIPVSIKNFSEIIVVDGLSKDNTVLEAKKTEAKVIFERRAGKGIAMMTGAKYARGDILIFIDGDGSYPSKDIPKFIELLKNYEVVIGNAYQNLWMIRDDQGILAYMFFLFTFNLSKFLFSKIGIKLDDPLDGMRAIKKENFLKLNLKAKGFEIEAEMDIKARKNSLKIGEVLIKINKRKGRSKFILDFKCQLKIMSLIIKEFFKLFL